MRKKEKGGRRERERRREAKRTCNSEQDLYWYLTNLFERKSCLLVLISPVSPVSPTKEKQRSSQIKRKVKPEIECHELSPKFFLLRELPSPSPPSFVVWKNQKLKENKFARSGSVGLGGAFFFFFFFFLMSWRGVIEAKKEGVQFRFVLLSRRGAKAQPKFVK